MTYSSSLSYSRQRFAVRGQNAVSFRDTSKKLGPISTTIVVIVLLALLGLVYLTQITKTNSYSYEISRLQDSQKSLQEERASLELTAARLQSFDAIKSASAQAGLVSVAPTAIVQN
jgi:hypothetical protein